MKGSRFHILFASVLFNIILMMPGTGNIFITGNGNAVNPSGELLHSCKQIIHHSGYIDLTKAGKKAGHYFSQAAKSVSAERQRHKKAYERDLVFLQPFPQKIKLVLREHIIDIPGSPTLESVILHSFRRGPPVLS